MKTLYTKQLKLITYLECLFLEPRQNTEYEYVTII